MCLQLTDSSPGGITHASLQKLGTCSDRIKGDMAGLMDTETCYYLAVEWGTPGFPKAFICRGNLVMMTPNQCEERIQRDVK